MDEGPIAMQTGLVEVRRATDRGRGGRGVYARVDIAKGTLIERAPVLLVPSAQVFYRKSERDPPPRLTWYVFDWTGVCKRDYVAVALGYGSLYNHRIRCNAEWDPVPPDLIEFRAHRDIAAGEEVTINYHGEPGDAEPVKFEARP